MMSPMSHEAFLQRCLALASQGRGHVGNGAMVGAVLVRNGQIIAEGVHRGFGQPHAERDLLENYDGPIKPQDVLCVNLEPCCHEGKTPPCTDIILERGIRHVVYGMKDPDVRASGRGIRLLQSKGIEVTGPVLRAQCEWFNRGFVSVRAQGRPWITLKSARTLDDRIANADGSPLAITSSDQNEWSHAVLRYGHDAILVGVQTVLRDNPLLSVRLKTHGALMDEKNSMNTIITQFQPKRIILDPGLRTPESAKLVTDTRPYDTILVVDPDTAEPDIIQFFRSHGVRVLPVTMTDGVFDWASLWSVLITPFGDDHGITSILVEGGQKTWNAFRSAGVVDEEVSLCG